MRTRGTALGLALALGLLGSGCTVGGPARHAGNQADPGPVRHVEWRGCGDGEAFQAGEVVHGKPQCGYLTVPTDWGGASPGEQSLAVTRMRASGNRRGVLVVNFGGPGATATDRVMDLHEALPAKLRADYDLVAMDPRGVGESGRLSCADPGLRTLKPSLDAAPDTDLESRALEESVGRLGRSCALRQPSLIGHLGSSDLARDVDALRATLGVVRISLLGYSYGSLMAYEYARLFPERVERMVLDGAVVPGADPGRAAVDRGRAAQQALEWFAEECAELGCPLGKDARTVLATLTAVQQQLELTPVPVPGGPAGAVVNEGRFTALLFTTLYAPALADQFAEAVPSLRAGDPTAFVELADRVAQAEEGISTTIVDGVTWATLCLDRPRARTSRQTHLEAVGSSPVFGRLVAAEATMCSDWPVSAQPLAGTPLPPAVGAKALLVSNSADPTTPRAGADQLARLLPGSSHLRVEAWGHTATFLGFECVDRAVTAFLLDGTRDAALRGCPAG